MDSIRSLKTGPRLFARALVAAVLSVLFLLVAGCELVQVGDLYPGTWRGPFVLAGGADSTAPEFITPEVWYTSTLADGEEGWYAVRVTNGATYEVYLDDRADGSGVYSGDVQIAVTNDGELIDYGDALDAYDPPLVFEAEEDIILIQVSAPNAGDGGTIAVGIQSQ